MKKKLKGNLGIRNNQGKKLFRQCLRTFFKQSNMEIKTLTLKKLFRQCVKLKRHEELGSLRLNIQVKTLFIRFKSF